MGLSASRIRGTCPAGKTCSDGACLCTGSTCPATLFGGLGPDGALADTWSFDGTSWTQLDVTGPAPRSGAVMAPLNGKLVLYGGTVQGPGNVYDASDLWTWDGRSWTEVFQRCWFSSMSEASCGSLTIPPGIGERDEAVMAPLNGTLVLYGGCVVGPDEEDPSPGCGGFTWTWDGTSWTAVSSAPGPMVGGSSDTMAPIGGSLLLLEGSEAATWNGASWAASTAGATGPSPRSQAIMAPLNGKIVLFGGVATTGEVPPYSDTWTWDGTSWTQAQVVGPSARANGVMAPVDGKLVLFGGYNYMTQESFADTWSWDGTEWTQLEVAGPSARSQSVMATP